MDTVDSKVLSKNLIIEGECYKTNLTPKFENRKIWVKENPKFIRSFMPGTIIKVSVIPGQEVKAGNEMILIDSMKMRSHILVPFMGKIKNINITEGQQVPKGYTMIEFE